MGRLILLLTWPLGILFALSLIAVAIEQGAGSDSSGLLVNGGFEDGDTGWEILGGKLVIVEQADAPELVAEGARAARLDAGSEQVLRAYQYVPGAAGGTFQFSGLALVADPDVEWVRLELSWHTVQGGYDEVLSTQLGGTGGIYQQLSTSAAVVPCDAVQTRVSIAVRRVAAATGGQAYVDGLQLVVGPPLACPTSTPSPTLSPTVTETATSTATTVPTLTTTPTPSGTRTPTSTRTETSTRTPTATRTQTSAPTPAATRTATEIPAATLTRTPTGTPLAPATGTPTPLPAVTAQATASPTLPGPTPTMTPSHGLLINGGFEDVDGGTPIGWRTFGGVLTQASAPVLSGSAAGCFASITASTKWVFQTVVILPGGWYDLGAYVWHDDPAVDAAWLRISWYASHDGTGSAISTVDSTSELTQPLPGFRYLTTDPVQAPPDAHSANVRIMLRPVSDAKAVICVDDVTLVHTAAPPTVTPTATTTSSPTPTATSPRPTATPTRPPTAIPTATGTATSPAPPEATAIASSQPVGTPTATPAASVDATATSPSASEPPTPLGDLLVNGGFEDASGDGLAGWSHYGGLFSQVEEPVHSGSFAGALFSSTNSTKWAYQTVAVTPLEWYEMDAFVLHDHPGVETAWLRISWYESGDGSGSAVISVDSPTSLDEAAPAYRELRTGPVQAPPGVHSARARIMLRPWSDGSALIYMDDVSFRAVSPPDALDTPAGVPPQEQGFDDRAAAADPNGSVDSRPAGRILSEVLGLVITPQPTPVIRRSDVVVPEEQPPPPGEETRRKWQWVIAAGLLAAGISGAAVYGPWWPAIAGEGGRA